MGIKKSLLSLALSTIVLLAGCTTQSASPAPSASAENSSSLSGSNSQGAHEAEAGTLSSEYIYTVVLEDQNKMVALDQAGNVLLEDQIVRVLYDAITEKPYLLVAERLAGQTLNFDDSGERLAFPDESALFDLQGKLILDWQSNHAYAAAFGEYVVLQDPPLRETFENTERPATARCLNYVTGETVLANFSNIEPVGNGKEAQVFREGKSLGLVNSTMEKTKGWPWKEEMSIEMAWNDYYIAKYQNNNTKEIEFYYQYQLLDQQLAPVIPGYYQMFVFDCTFKDYLFFGKNHWPKRTSDLTQISMGSVSREGQVEYLPPEITEILFYDGELIMAGVDASLNKNLRPDTLNVLMEKSGKILVEYPLPDPGSVVRFKDGTFNYTIYQNESSFITYDRNGEVIAEIALDNTSLFYVISTELVYYNSYEPLLAVFRDKQLETVASFESSSVSPIADTDEYFINVDSSESSRYSLINTRGDAIIEGIDKFKSTYGGRMVVLKDGFLGLMDYEGNWLYKISAE